MDSPGIVIYIFLKRISVQYFQNYISFIFSRVSISFYKSNISYYFKIIKLFTMRKLFTILLISMFFKFCQTIINKNT
jgi:hypothetical protein